MSLLGDLLASLPPTVACATKQVPAQPRLALVERTAQPRVNNLAQAPDRATASASTPPRSRTYSNAASATPVWRHARDQYIDHIMICRGCCAPTGRHCPAGAELRATYDNTPMEPAQ